MPMDKIVFTDHIPPSSSLTAARRKKIAELLGIKDETSLYFFSNGGESHFQLIFSTYLNFTCETGRNHLLTLESEERSILQAIKSLEPLGLSGKFLSVGEQGQLTAEILKERLRPRAAMLSLSIANGQTGVIHPIWDIAQICREKGLLLHLDMTHAIGSLYFHLQEIEADFFTFDVAGVGGVLVAKEKFTPCYERGDAISELDKITTYLEKKMDQIDHICTETTRLRDKWEKGIMDAFPDASIFFQNASRLPHVSAFAIPGVHANSLSYLLQKSGISISSGTLSTVLAILGIPAPLNYSALGLVLSYKTTEEEIDRALEICIPLARKLQSYSGSIYAE